MTKAFAKKCRLSWIGIEKLQICAIIQIKTGGNYIKFSMNIEIEI